MGTKNIPTTSGVHALLITFCSLSGEVGRERVAESKFIKLQALQSQK